MGGVEAIVKGGAECEGGEGELLMIDWWIGWPG